MLVILAYFGCVVHLDNPRNKGYLADDIGDDEADRGGDHGRYSEFVQRCDYSFMLRRRF